MRKKINKPRNAGTMTESAFWGFIRSTLRRKTIMWKPISVCKQNSKRAYKGFNKRQKFEYQCNICKNFFPDKEVNVDHIKCAGSLQSSKDLEKFIDTLFCEQDNLQTVCLKCHAIKTQNEKVNRKLNKT